MINKEALADIRRKMKVLDLRIKDQDRRLSAEVLHSYAPNIRGASLQSSSTSFSKTTEQHFEQFLSLLPATYLDLCDIQCYREYQQELQEADNKREKEEAKDAYIECINEC